MVKKATKKVVKKPAPKPEPKTDKRYELPPFAGRLPLNDAIDGLMAYDSGATDSGIHDPQLRVELDLYVRKLTIGQKDLMILAFIHERMHPPYLVEDLVSFLGWCRDILGIDMPSSISFRGH